MVACTLANHNQVRHSMSEDAQVGILQFM